MLWLLCVLPVDEWALFGNDRVDSNWSLFAQAENTEDATDVGVDYSRWGVVKFTAKWCGPCRTQDSELAKLPDGIQIRRIDIDGNRAAARAAKVGSIPDTRLIYRNDAGEWVQVLNGRTRQRWVGVVTSSRILAEIEKRSDSGQNADPADIPKTVSQRWSVNGNFNASRSYLIQHLSGGNHGHSRETLKTMTINELIRLHDLDHESKQSRTIRRRVIRRG